MLQTQNFTLHDTIHTHLAYEGHSVCRKRTNDYGCTTH